VSISANKSTRMLLDLLSRKRMFISTSSVLLDFFIVFRLL